ncbi:MAG: DUF3810 domain-containing protein [Ruminococcaceae bacterium]|nr:DUF3810 domain-containing protein [Oscillospiraceae bacterium]
MKNKEKRKAKQNKKQAVSPIPMGAVILLSLGIVGFFIQLFSSAFPKFADYINSTVGHFLRFVLANIFNIFPFSFMEFLFLSSPLIIICTAVLICKRAKMGRIFLIRSLSSLLSIFSCVYFLFSVGFAPGYHTTSLAERLGLKVEKAQAVQVYDTAVIMAEKLNDLCADVSYLSDGSSVLLTDYGELSDKLCDSYRDLYSSYGLSGTFDARIKPLVISPYMTYTHLSGIYSFFTGEANLNTNYPDFINVYTTAHEMAHQRGISREDEANFCAFLVLLESDSPYLQYCAYLNMFLYLTDALYSSSVSMYNRAYSLLDGRCTGDIIAYSEFFDKYRDSSAADISDSLNDAYLESQGTAGVESYGMVVELAVSYYQD